VNVNPEWPFDWFRWAASVGGDPGRVAAADAAARELIGEYLSGWELRWSPRAKDQAGLCVHGDRAIVLSGPLMSLWEPGQQRDTILHEIAHALTPGHHHDRVWQAMCVRVGADPSRTWGHSGETRIPGKWEGACPSGHVVSRHKRPAAHLLYSCERCGTRAAVITWKER
jgi:predicted SprT family Zn-dependent metalloprotease